MQLLLYINQLLNKNCSNILRREISMKRNTIYTKFQDIYRIELSKFHIPRYIPKQGKFSGHYQDFQNFQDVGHPVIRKAFFLTIALSPQYLIDYVQCLLGCLTALYVFQYIQKLHFSKIFLAVLDIKVKSRKTKTHPINFLSDVYMRTTYKVVQNTFTISTIMLFSSYN